MMRLTRARLVVLLGLVVFASGWVRLPVPGAWLPDEFELDGSTVQVSVGDARLCWARGQLRVSDLHVKLEGESILVAPKAEAHVGLVPFTGRFAKPYLLTLSGPEIRIDEAKMRRLSSRKSEPSKPKIPHLSFAVIGGRLTWLGADGRDLTWEVDELRGRLAHARSDVRLAGRMLTPVQSQVRAKASSQRGLRSWWFHLEGENARAEDAWNPQDIEVLRGIEVRPGQYSFRIAAQKKDGQDIQSELQLSLQDASAEITEPPLNLSGIQLQASGGLREGVRAEIRALVDDDFRVLAQGRMQWPEEGGAWLTLRGDSTSVVVDQDRLDWVRLLHPITAEILEALEVRGGPEARFGLDWREGEELGWVVHADTSGMQMRYRGIVTSTGEKPAFPYPVQSTRGDFAAAGRWLMMDVAGEAGVGKVRGRGVVEIRPDDSGVYLDIEARGVAVDREIRAAATGTPQLAELWRQLGIPQGGTTDVDLRIRADNAREHTGLTIGGVGRGVRVLPLEMPIPLLLDEVEFFWTMGYASFESSLTSPGGPVHLKGEFREAENAEYPGIRATLSGAGLAPDLRTRRTLIERLDLPGWMTQFAPRGDSELKLVYHQAATAEAPQYMLRVDGADMELDWGTALGNAFVPFTGVRELEGPFQLAGSRDTHHWIAPALDAEFGARPIQASLQGGSDTASIVTASSEGLRLPAPAAGALARLLQLEELLGPMQVDVTSDVLFEWETERDDPLAGKLKLSPLRLRLPDDDAPLELYGEIMVSGGRLEAPRFRLERGDGWVEIDDLVFYFGADRQELSAVLDSAKGIELGPEIYELLGPEATSALTQLGLRGEIGPRDVAVRYVREETGPATLVIERGEILMQEVTADGPPDVEGGAGRIVIESFLWNEDFGVDALLRLSEGRGVVSGVPVRNARGLFTVTPERITLTDLHADALGGWVRTRNAEDNGGTPGRLSVGLVPDVPVEAQIEFGKLQLAQLQSQLDLDAGAGGELRGWLLIDSPTLEVLDYLGSGRLDITEGRLTTVPILEQIWGLVDTDPPLFREGTVKFRLPGDGRVRIEEFELRHDLLNVAGKGWIHFDGFVRLKVSLRRVMLFLGLPVTDLPLLSQFFDLFIEQEVFGPIDRLQLAPRSVRKILGRDLPQVPTPLWVPGPKRRPDGVSPIFPLHEDASGR